MVSFLKRLLVGVGLITTGLIISSLQLHPIIHPLRTYQAQIFYTNCLILLSPHPISAQQALPSVPPECATIQWALPAGLIASGIIILLFGFTGTACFFSALSLLGYLSLYCNTLIDTSFRVYAHALEVLTCIFGFGYAYLKTKESQIQKNQYYR